MPQIVKQILIYWPQGQSESTSIKLTIARHPEREGVRPPDRILIDHAKYTNLTVCFWGDAARTDREILLLGWNARVKPHAMQG